MQKEITVMTFADFKARCLKGFRRGSLRVSVPLTDLDMAVQYICGIAWEQGNNELTTDEIAKQIIERCGYFPSEDEIFWDQNAGKTDAGVN